MRKRPPIVTVFGSSFAPPGSALHDTAYALGGEIARSGWILCNGGYGGTMEAAARGAVEAGGHTIGVTLRGMRRGAPNPFIRQEVPTFDLFHRLNTLLRLGRAYVVLPGGTGTLLELAAVWEAMNKKLLRSSRCLVLLGPHWNPVVGCVLASQSDAPTVDIVEDVEAACRAIGLALAY
jgi:uncharacterized protein (TIGR00730 family)